MSLNTVNKSTGELVTLANGTRMWIGTQSAHDLAVQQGTMPNNCMVCITDDYKNTMIGEIKIWCGPSSSVPDGWLYCDGSAVSRTTYADLFAVIGTAFGRGDGSTTFNIPDLRGEFLRGAGTNSHRGQGSGGKVGQHQDATRITNYYVNDAVSAQFFGSDTQNVSNADSFTNYSGHSVIFNGSSTPSSTNVSTVRPTNTSVNFIICYE